MKTNIRNPIVLNYKFFIASLVAVYLTLGVFSIIIHIVQLVI